MTRLHTQYQRLYQLPATDTTPEVGGWMGARGEVRALVLALAQPADWASLSPVWRGVQADLDLPAPAIAVNGVDAFELWFSLAQPVPLHEAVAFLEGLQQRYLPDLKPGRVKHWPTADGTPSRMPRIPAQHAPDRWSAFVAPDLAAVFDGDDPSLDFQPGEDAQADLLSRLRSIQSDDWQAAVAALQPVREVVPAATAVEAVPVAPAPLSVAAFAMETTHAASPRHPALRSPYEDPRQFLRDVMNDSSAPLALRLEAAKALLG